MHVRAEGRPTNQATTISPGCTTMVCLGVPWWCPTNKGHKRVQKARRVPCRNQPAARACGGWPCSTNRRAARAGPLQQRQPSTLMNARTAVFLEGDAGASQPPRNNDDGTQYHGEADRYCSACKVYTYMHAYRLDASTGPTSLAIQDLHGRYWISSARGDKLRPPIHIHEEVRTCAALEEFALYPKKNHPYNGPSNQIRASGTAEMFVQPLAPQ